MQPNGALDPENRALYAEILRAPAGFELEAALATTYSLDFETALVIPATLAFHAAESRQQTLDSPLALLEGLERLSSRIAIFCEGGRISAMPKGVSRLTALLEDTVIEVSAPLGGAFHPKLWVLRFASLVEPNTTRLRLVILSRNLTTDTSWDLSLCLEGVPGPAPVKANEPIARLLRVVPRLATGRAAPVRSVEIAESLARDVESACWEHPPGVRDISFAVNGLGGPVWAPEIGETLGVISPFVSDTALSVLASRVTADAAHLLARSEELALLDTRTLSLFGRVLVLDEMAETEDGEDTSSQGAAAVARRGLHAKAYLTERDSTTEITVGSGNATAAALLGGENVEVFVTLKGPTRDLGTVRDHFAPERLGRYLRDFTPFSPPDNATEQVATERLEEVRRQLARSDLVLACEDIGERRIALHLSAKRPVTIPMGIQLRLWPLVVGSQNGIDVQRIGEQPLVLGHVALRDVTRWLGIRLCDEATGVEQSLTLGADLKGLPDARTSEILRSIIENREAFLRYVRLLLGDMSDRTEALFSAGKDGIGGNTFAIGQDGHLLEDMVRALCGDGRQLRDVERLVNRLRDGGEDTQDVIPAEFLDLWKTFQEVMRDGNDTHV